MAEEIRTKLARPYNSIEIRVPENWNQDSTAREFCVYFFPENGWPPTFHVRRDDFMADGSVSGRPGKGQNTLPKELEERFADLVERMEAPDIMQYSVEPKSSIGQLIRYTRVGDINGKPGIAYWWVKGRRFRNGFAVMSCSLEILGRLAEDPETKNLIAFFDKEVSASKILSLEEAKSEDVAKKAASKIKKPAMASPAAADEAVPTAKADQAPVKKAAVPVQRASRPSE